MRAPRRSDAYNRKGRGRALQVWPLGKEEMKISIIVMAHEYEAQSRPTHLFNIVVRHEACRLVLIVSAGLLLCFPPAIVAILVEDVEQIAVVDCELALGLRRVVIDGPVHPQKPHVGES